MFVKEKILTPEECSLICIRTSKWKYVHFPSLPSLLFDLENDTLEMKNLAEDKKYYEIKNVLLSELSLRKGNFLINLSTHSPKNIFFH